MRQTPPQGGWLAGRVISLLLPPGLPIGQEIKCIQKVLAEETQEKCPNKEARI